jgi:hypothetical protein
MGNTKVDKNRVPCSWCGKFDPPHNEDLKEAGTNVGNSQNLSKILMKSYGGVPAREHPLSMPKGMGSCAQAHHLICCEAMDTDEWGVVCSNFGYNINCKENGVLLPADMRIACQLKVPLHRGNHSATETTENVKYVVAVTNKIEGIVRDAFKKKYCEKEKEIISELKAVSDEIWAHVKAITWTLTYDGYDYLGGPRGCLGETSLRKKRENDKAGATCDANRNHHLSIMEGSFYKEK